MPISPSEAQQALKEISATEAASARAHGYHAAAPHLIVWGAIWALGYGADYFLTPQPFFWPLLVFAGLLASAWYGWRSGRSGAPGSSWRYLATGATILLFVAALFAIAPPRSDEQMSAFFPVLVAFLYGLLGIWSGGARLIVAGAVIAALTLVGYFWLQPIFLLWMAVVGGGALILGGLWFRKA